MIELVLYCTETDILKEMAFYEWMGGDISEKNDIFLREAEGEWDLGYSGSYELFIKGYVRDCWYQYVWSN